MPDLPEVGAFHTSSFSGGGNCVEVARSTEGWIIVRDTKDPARRNALMFDLDEWSAFVRGVKNGEFEP